MTDPTPAVLAAFAWLDRLTGIQAGEVSVHALALLAEYEAAARGWHAMRAERDQARAAVADLAAAVQKAVNEGGSLADVVAAIAALPAVQGAIDHTPTQLREAS